jgi:tRNA (cytidine32/uridine32-2'-O)-methyltransferase
MRQTRIVLVNTSHPGNIGAAARAMKNMGLQQLYLVAPHQFPCAEATARAAGADDLLAKAVCVDTLDAALAGCGLVIGSSARSRTLAIPELNPRECAELAMHEPQSTQAAIVFGRERTGLSNAELDRCHYLVQIPTDPDYPSLNLAAAVQVICYELRMAMGLMPLGQEKPQRFATADEMELFYQHLENTLIEVEFLSPDNPRQLMRRLRRLFGRVRVNENEINILRGILTAVNSRKR